MKPDIDIYGDKRWINDNGEYHREDGPAIEYVNGDKEWYLNGKRHREDGPAVEWANGIKFWFINGEELSESEFKLRTQLTNHGLEDLL